MAPTKKLTRTSVHSFSIDFDTAPPPDLLGRRSTDYEEWSRSLFQRYKMNTYLDPPKNDLGRSHIIFTLKEKVGALAETLKVFQVCAPPSVCHHHVVDVVLCLAPLCETGPGRNVALGHVIHYPGDVGGRHAFGTSLG